MFAALAKIGAVFAPLNARASRRRGRARRRVRPPAAAAVRRRRTSRPAPSSRRGSTCRSRPRSRGGAADAADAADLDERDPHVIFFTSGSTGRPKGVVLSHRTNWLRTYVGATTTAGRRGHRLHVPAVPHGGLDDRAGRVAGPPAGALRAHPRRRDAACTPPPATAPRGCTASPRCGRASSNTASATSICRASTRPTPARRPRRPSSCARSRTRSPTPQTRVFYGSTEAGPGVQLGDADLFRKPGQRRCRATGRRGAARRRTARCACAARS